MSQKPSSLRAMSLKCAGVLAVALLASARPAAAEEPVGTAFTYSGELQQGGAPVNATCDFEFSLWDDGDPALPENQVGATLSQVVIVEDGRLTEVLDFGPDIFTGNARFLEIAVCCPPDNCSSPPTNFTTLSPRQELTPAPHALALPGLYTDQTSSPPNVIAAGDIQADGTITSGNSITIDGTNDEITASTGTIGFNDENLVTSGVIESSSGGFRFPDATLQTTALPSPCADGEVVKWNDTMLTWECATDNVGGGGGGNTLDQAYDQNGPGAGRTIVADAGPVRIQGAGGLRVISIITGGEITIDGTISGSEKITSSNDLELHVGSGRALRIEENTTSPNIIAGHSDNSVAGAVGATIAGGGSAAFPNRVTADFGTVGGGDDNLATGIDSTVGGGVGNTAAGISSTVGGGFANTAAAQDSTVGGGAGNTAAGVEATVGGGTGNEANGIESTVGGGFFNSAQDLHATVGGGFGNSAQGAQSTVGGGQINFANTLATVGGGDNNTAFGLQSTIGGGFMNIANGEMSIIGGGALNTANGDQSIVGGGIGNDAGGRHSTVGGGNGNVANGDDSTIGGGFQNNAGGDFATVGGGDGNEAGNWGSTVGGGGDNVASGGFATVPGGENNTAAGATSFAAGQWAQANDQGSFVWADSTTTALNFFASTGLNQFLIKATGGVGINTNDPAWTFEVKGSGINLKEAGDGPGPDIEEDRVLLAETGMAAGSVTTWGPGAPGAPPPNNTLNVLLSNSLASADTGVLALYDPNEDLNVLLTHTANSFFAGEADFFGANGNLNVQITVAQNTTDEGWMGVFDPDGDRNVSITSVVGAPKTGGIGIFGTNGFRNILLTMLATNPDHGQISVLDGGGVQQATMYVDAAGEGQIFGDDLTVSGHISGATIDAALKAFKIDHPLDPADKYLYHSSVESPDMMNVYNGNVVTDTNGEASVKLPTYFEALNKNFRYQLTVIGQFAQAIVGTKIKDNRFSIRTDKPNVEVSWQVTGVRKDAFAEAHRIVAEVDKVEQELGRYLHPEVFGQPPEMRIPDISAQAQAAPPAAAQAAPAARAPPAPPEPRPAPVSPIEPNSDLE